jgi:hypothetical protein
MVTHVMSNKQLYHLKQCEQPKLHKCDFFRLRNELDRNQFLLGISNRWIILEFQSFQFEYLFRYVQSCGSIEVILIECVVKISLGRHVELLTRLNHGQQPGHGWGPKQTIYFNLFWIRWMNRSKTWNAIWRDNLMYSRKNCKEPRLQFLQR